MKRDQAVARSVHRRHSPPSPLTVAVRAGGDKVVFPPNYAKGVLYTTVDRADNKQYRELYASKEAVDAVKAGKPIPSGTVLTHRPATKAKLNAAGEPEKDANGRFIKTAMHRRLHGDGEAHGLGRRVCRRHAQRRVGVPGVQGRQDA